jgi:hypothetical protein
MTSVHWVVTPSQVIDVPGTLVQELTGVQLKTPNEQVVVQVPVWAATVPPRKLAKQSTVVRPIKVKTLCIQLAPFLMFLNDTPFSVPCRSRYLNLLLAACLVAACGNDNAKSRAAAARPSDADSAAAAAALAAAPTALTLTGPAAFEGATPVHCVASGANGLQINFRTGDEDTPAVAVRIDDYHGSGTYPAQVFVTGRSDAGGLVTSNGEAHLEVRQEDPPGAVAVLSGKLDGAYQGAAGGGSIAGRFAGCGYSKDRGGAPQEASATLVPSHEGSGADLAEDPPAGKADSSAKDAAQDVGTPPVRPRQPAPAARGAGHPHRRPHRAAHRRRPR